MTHFQPKALDLFCGAGGVTKGLQRAGFHVTGVDIKKQPRYCGDLFVQGDALRPPFRLEDFAFVWASPPCQHYTRVWWGHEEKRQLYPDLVAEVRDMLSGHRASTIENVMGAPIKASVVLTGAHFGLPIVRDRAFECRGFRVPLPLAAPMPGSVSNGELACVAGHGANRGRSNVKWTQLEPALKARLSKRNCAAGWREAMDIDWMTRAEMAQAIPPAYAEYIGRAAIATFRP